MTLEEFIAEIENTFKNYTETGDVSRLSIKTWVIECLREFGKNICEKNEDFLEVRNSSAKLPENFKSLILAVRLHNVDYDQSTQKDSYVYEEIIENPGYYDWTTNQFVTNCDGKLITKKIITPTETVKRYYQPQYLSIVKGFNKRSFDVDCINLNPAIRDAEPYKINITNTTLNTNFKTGEIYIQYNSFPLDEDGEIIIPEYTTGDLVKYVSNFVKIKLAEELILNNKNPTGIQNLIPMWLQKEVPLRNAAMSECTFNSLSSNWTKKYKQRLQAEENKFNLPRR